MSNSAASATTSAPNATMQPPAARRGLGLRFSLRTLLLVMLLIAVYLGGRASISWRYALAPRLDGDWEAKLPRGFVRSATIQSLGKGHYLLRSQASIFNGKSRWENGLLITTEPADERMLGLEWKWDGQKLTLISEPKNTPTGSSYTGTVLSRPVSPPPGQ